ncbi:hypothetical protein [Streptomyces brasiliscabiei]|uniref:hypothetical protein n=1 Tax=Streptomyces brasiliscabiei TaxID=2736302 RepID=UPI001C114F20|nr:hypothetical protein [Streptomyces brasiliscabiei]
MRTWTRAVPAAMGALALAVALSGCNDSASGKDSGSAGAKASAAKKASYRLGEASPPQESTMQASKGATYTVTPTKVRMGTQADMKNSGVQLDKSDGPQVPVYVSATLTHKSGKAMTVGDMDDDLVVATDKGQRTKALIVLMGQAKWPSCPASDTEKHLSGGQSAKICSVFLVPEGQKASAVELAQGYYNDPLKWPVKN